MQQPIFILGFHKSGTSLLRSLLDGVPGVFAIPIETHIFEHFGFWIDYEIRRQLPQEVSFDQMLSRIKNVLILSNQKNAQKGTRGGDSTGNDTWQIEEFEQNFSIQARLPFERNDLSAFINAYFDALHLALKGRPPDPTLRYVEKTVENTEFTAYLKKAYPDAIFLHIIRNPYAALVGSRKFRTTHNRFPYLGTILRAMENSYYHAFHNPQVFENYHMIKYEDLVQNTRDTMEQVAQITGLNFDPAMLTPSTLGKPWKGNSMSGQDFEGVSQAPVDAWQKEILPLETSLINVLLPHVFTKFGYEVQRAASSAFAPCKGETISMYVANRFFWLISRNRRTSMVKM